MEQRFPVIWGLFHKPIVFKTEPEMDDSAQIVATLVEVTLNGWWFSKGNVLKMSSISV